MNTRTVYCVLMLALASSCQVVEYYDYVHQPTHEIRNSLVWQQSSIKKVSELTDEPVLLIPNLRTFTSSYPMHEATLMLCSDTIQKIVVQDASLKNVDSGYTETITLNEEVTISTNGFKNRPPLRTWIYLFKDDTINYPRFDNATNLILEVHYRYPSDGTNGPPRIRNYEMKLRKVKDVAWPT